MSPNPIEAVKRLIDHTLTAQDVVGGALRSIDPDWTVGEGLEVLEFENFDVAGVGPSGAPAAAYVTRAALEVAPLTLRVGDLSRPIPSTLCVERSLPLSRLIDVLKEREFAFVLHDDAVQAVITRSDLESPAVAVGVLSLIMVIESQLATLNREALGHAQDLVALLPEERRRAAESLFEQRCEDNSEIGIDSCLYLIDWIELTCRTETYRWVGYQDADAFRREFVPLGDLRNDLAHNRSILNGRTPSEALERIVAVRQLAERLVVALANPEHYMIGAVSISMETSDGRWSCISGPAAETGPPDGAPVCVVSAMNSCGVVKTYRKNRRAHAALVAWMYKHAGAWTWSEAHCWADEPPWQESAVAISGIEISEAIALAERFGQQTIFVVDDETTTLLGLIREDEDAEPIARPKQRVPRR